MNTIVDNNPKSRFIRRYNGYVIVSAIGKADKHYAYNTLETRKQITDIVVTQAGYEYHIISPREESVKDVVSVWATESLLENYKSKIA